MAPEMRKMNECASDEPNLNAMKDDEKKQYIFKIFVLRSLKIIVRMICEQDSETILCV